MSTFGNYEFNLVADIEEKSIKTRLFPNPTTGELYAVIETAGSIKVEIRDIQGRMSYSNSNYTNGTQIDLTGFNNGLYLVLITTEQGTVTKKIVKR